MTYRSQLGRYVVIVLALVALAAGTTTATRWMPWSPLNTCLFCGTASVSPVTAPEERVRVAATTATLGDRLGHSVTQADVALVPSTIGPASPSGRDDDRSASRGDGSGDQWQPWGNTVTTRNGGGDSAAAFHGLSRLMSTSISGGGSSVRPSVPVATPHASALEDKPFPAADPAPTPAPPATPTPGGPTTTVVPPAAGLPAAGLPPAGGGSTAPVIAAGPNPTAPFNEQHAPAPTAFVPTPPAGPLSANEQTSLLLPSEGTPSATPEPASMMLLATGLVVALGELRRRRVM